MGEREMIYLENYISSLDGCVELLWDRYCEFVDDGKNNPLHHLELLLVLEMMQSKDENDSKYYWTCSDNLLILKHIMENNVVFTYDENLSAEIETFVHKNGFRKKA
jgi:hypothetical protein